MARASISPGGRSSTVDHYRGPQAACEAFGSMRFLPLPGARAEADAIATLWEKQSPRGTPDASDMMVLHGLEAGEAAFKDNAAGHRVLHLATHGFFVDDRCRSALAADHGKTHRSSETLPPAVGDNPLLLSGLALAGANRRGAGGGDADTDDGILTSEEIASLDLSGVEWAVLSGCETGLGKVQAGEGVLGLRRAFEIAGARTLIMSLWQVEDQATIAWMKRLYASRLSGLSTAEAMRDASLQTLAARRRAGKDTHPFYWGAFVAAGDWR